MSEINLDLVTIDGRIYFQVASAFKALGAPRFPISTLLQEKKFLKTKQMTLNSNNVSCNMIFLPVSQFDMFVKKVVKKITKNHTKTKMTNTPKMNEAYMEKIEYINKTSDIIKKVLL